MNCTKAEYRRHYRQTHQEEIREYRRQHRKEQQEYNKRYQEQHRDEIREYTKRWREQNGDRVNEFNKRFYAQLKYAVLSHYTNGSLQCAECGKDGLGNLSIDHIAGGGCRHRAYLNLNSSYQFYLWLRRSNYPNGYRVLCKSCNSKQQPKRCREQFHTGEMIRQVITEKQINRARDIIDYLESQTLSRHAISSVLYYGVRTKKLGRISKGYYLVLN